MKIATILVLSVFLSQACFGQMEMGVDIYSRYVWRGTDFGNSASIQPYLEYSAGGITIGAWGAWAMNGAEGGNENDLFISTSLGPVEITVTDYFFPTYSGDDDIFTIDNHILEASLGYELKGIPFLVAMNVSGDNDNSTYIEAGYRAITVGLGNGFYSKNGEFAPVNIAISGEKENLSVSYVLNPDSETSFLIVGVSF